MKSLKLMENITWVGALDPNLRVFDIVMETKFGTTYNSYMVEGDKKIALFETVKVKCFDEYIEKLRALVDVSQIEYIVVSHTEPDHVGSVEKMLEINPNIKIVGSKTAIKFLKSIVNKEFQSIVVNTGDTLDLGNKTLEFIMAPFLHWPDTMYTYIKEDKVLITCDSFGAHYSFDEILLSKVKNRDDYNSALKYYYNMIMGPFKSHVLNAIEKIKDKEISMILPGHGPVLDENPWEIVGTYRKWSTEETIFNEKTVVVPYVSAYGYTETLAKSIEAGLKSEENLNVHLFDMVTENAEDVLSEIRWADGLLFGSPTINGDALPPIWNLLMNMSPIIHGKKLVAAFGSYGWSGEAVANLEARFKMLRLKQFEPGLRILFKPSEEELDLAFDYGKRFAQKLLGKDKKAVLDVPKISTIKPIVESDGEIKSWICVVCGDVFEGEVPPDICPTCGASQDQFEEYFDEENIVKSENKFKIIIIGNGIAGLAAAKSIRKRNKIAEILIIGDEKELTYNRPMLSDYLADDYEKDQFYIESIKWYEENNVQQLLNTRVIKVDTNEKNIITKNKEIYKYDKLILASGSHNFIPSITDIKKAGVYSIRNIEYVKNIKKDLKKVENVVIIGGGLLGLEAANGFVKQGKKVTILEVMDQIVKRQLDFKTANYLKSQIENQGVRVLTKIGITALLGGDNVTGVQLDNGEIINADIVVVSAGIRSNIELFKSTNININHGVIVNNKMETNVENIYAAGDIAEFENRVYGIWPAASAQGDIAGANAVGDNKIFEHFTPSVVLNAFNTEIFSIGDICSKMKDHYSTLIFEDFKNGNYEKIVFLDDVLVGGLLVGNMKKTTKLISGIKRKATKDEIIAEIFS